MKKLIHHALAMLGVLSLATSASAQLIWTQEQPAASPAPRWGHAIYMMQPAFRPVLFGGFDGTQAFGDTWAWTGTTWQLRATTGPSPRHGHTLAMLHFSNNSLLLFGGSDAQGALLGDTWAWQGNAWTQLAPPVAPSARTCHAIAVDEMLERTLVLFGGRTANGLSSETWLFENDHWTLVPTATHPPAREGHKLAWSALTGGILLQGGRNAQGALADEWRFDGVDWHAVSANGAVARADHAFALEYFFRYRYVAFGGLDGQASADTSERTSDDRWLHHETIGAPSPRSHTALGIEYTGSHASYVLFGGRSAAGQALGDTWRMAPGLIASATPFGSGCGPGPWGPSGPALMASQPLLGSTVEVDVFGGGPARALLLIGKELAPTPVGGCGFLVKPTRTVVLRMQELDPTLIIGSYQLPIPFDTSLRGTTLALHVVERALGQPTLSFSRGVRLTLAD